MTRRALLSIGRNDCNFAEWLDSGHEALEAVRENSIVICTKQSHQFSPAESIARGTCFLKIPIR
jgi:hypothetical protein